MRLKYEFIFLLVNILELYAIEKCGIKPKHNFDFWRIIGGHDAKPGSWPWMVYLSLKSAPFLKVCGGTLINNKWILTAAHCLQIDDNPFNWMVVLEDFDPIVNATTQMVVDVVKIVEHPKFALEHGVFNDIALVQINQTLDLNGEHKYLTPICLPNDTKIDLVSAHCVITGWGHPKADGNATIILQEAIVPIVNSSICFEIFGFSIDIKTCICAGDLKAGGLGTCHGDSGGPLQCKMSNDQWYQFGIISWGKPCANPGIPDIYTKVVAYNEWIEEVIGSNY